MRRSRRCFASSRRRARVERRLPDALVVRARSARDVGRRSSRTTAARARRRRVSRAPRYLPQRASSVGEGSDSLPLFLLESRASGGRSGWWAARVPVRRLEARCRARVAAEGRSSLAWQSLQVPSRAGAGPIPPSERQLCARGRRYEATRRLRVAGAVRRRLALPCGAGRCARRLCTATVGLPDGRPSTPARLRAARLDSARPTCARSRSRDRARRVSLAVPGLRCRGGICTIIMSRSARRVGRTRWTIGPRSAPSIAVVACTAGCSGFAGALPMGSCGAGLRAGGTPLARYRSGDIAIQSGLASVRRPRDADRYDIWRRRGVSARAAPAPAGGSRRVARGRGPASRGAGI